MTRSTKPTFNTTSCATDIRYENESKIEQLKKLDENISCKIEIEKELESEIVEADDYLGELMDKRYRIQFFISANQATTPSPNNTLSGGVSAAQNYSQAVKENNYWPLKVTLTRRN